MGEEYFCLDVSRLTMKRKLFFAQYVRIKLVLPQDAWLSIFYRKIGSVAPPRGT